MGDFSTGSNSHVPEINNPVPTASYLNRFTNSESSTDEEGNVKNHKIFVSENVFVLTRSLNPPQVAVLSGMMTSLPLPCQRLHPLLQDLTSPLRRPQSGACWSPAGPALQTTPVFPFHRPTSPASPSHISPTRTSNKEASSACSHTNLLKVFTRVATNDYFIHRLM